MPRLSITQPCVPVIFVTGYAIPWLKRHIKPRKLDQLLTIGEIVVKAVEQESGAGLINIPKKQAAISRIEAWAGDVGVHVTDAQINDVIESAVMALNMEKQAKASAATPVNRAGSATSTVPVPTN